MLRKTFIAMAITSIAIVACLTSGCKSGCPACRETGIIHNHSHEHTQPDSRTITDYDTTDTITVWITNSNGSMTPITLKKQGQTYIGPKKEKYSNMPTPKQLKKTYGF